MVAHVEGPGWVGPGQVVCREVEVQVQGWDRLVGDTADPKETVRAPSLWQ